MMCNISINYYTYSFFTLHKNEFLYNTPVPLFGVCRQGPLYVPRVSTSVNIELTYHTLQLSCEFSRGRIC